MTLIITLIIGLFTFLGSLIVLFIKNNKKIIDFSISIGFGVLFSLIVLELIPETLELIQTKFMVVDSIFMVIILGALGILILKLLDKFIPDHNVNNNNNLIHIGIMTSIALTIHNILEGMVIYTSLNTSLNLGIILGIGVALHNIPLGMSITSLLYNDGKNNVKAMLICLMVSLATFMGGLVMFALKDVALNEFYRGIILSITLGMLVYIILFEFWPRMVESKNKSNTISGVVIGICLLILSTFFK